MEHCNLCQHSLEGNSHGFDQNDAWLEDDPLSETGYKVVHGGVCSYCKVCRRGE